MSIRKPLGAVLAIVFVVAGVSVASAQTGFGVQRQSGGPRFSFPGLNTASMSQHPSSSQLARIETSAPVLNGKLPESPRNEKESVPIASVVRLIAFEKGGQSFGSGSYIGNSGEYGLILSNQHVVKDCDGLLHVHFPNGFSTFGAVIDSDDRWDLAVIVVSKPPDSIVPIPISHTIPVPGEPLWIAGHGSGSYRLAGGRCVRYLAPDVPTDGSRPIHDFIELSVSARQGDSGGPILNQKGELAGVLFGSDMIRNTAGSHCGRASQFLSRTPTLLSRLPARPEVYFASIERDGPKRQLHETVNFTPAEALASAAAPLPVNIAGSSTSNFGVRSNSRRYVQNGSTADKAPSPPPNPASGSPRVPPVLPPTLPPSATLPTGPIKKAFWTPTGGSIPHVPPIGMVVQTGLSTEVVSAPMVPRDPFAENLSALNPTNDSEYSHQDIREHLRHAAPSQKYANVSRSPYTLATVPTGAQNTTSPPSIVLFGVFFLAGLLVFSAIRLIRADNVGFDDDEVTPGMPIRGRKSPRAA